MCESAGLDFLVLSLFGRFEGRPKISVERMTEINP